MIVSEKFYKTKLNNKIYDTVVFADIIELEQEKYFIVSGNLFNGKNIQQENSKYKNKIKDTFFSMEEEDGIDIYYLIYNLDKKKFIKNKNDFIKDKNLNKAIRLDRTKCEEIFVCGQNAYKIKTKQGEYIFMNSEEEENSYLLMNNKSGVVHENKFIFNIDDNKIDIVENDKISIEEIEKKNILKTLTDTNTYIKKIIEINNELKEEE